jgi:hypothetical protein
MKQKDIFVIVVVVVISAAISVFVSKWLFSVPAGRQTKVEVVTPITAEFDQPDSRYFNSNSVDPTKNISIGDNQNAAPFNDKTNSNGQ